MTLILPRRFDNIGVNGHFTLTTRDAVTGQIHEEVEADNLITNLGLQNLCFGFIYNLVQNQNQGWGFPISSAFANLGNCYGAVGTSSTPATATDVALGNEVSRTLVTNAAVVATNTFELDFFFGTAQANGTITEAGMFTSAYSLPTTLTSPLVNGTNYTTLAVNPWPLSNTLVPGGFGNAELLAGTIILIGYGNTTPIQYAQLSTTVMSGATSVPITAVGGGTFTANAAYAVGTTVEFGPNASGTTSAIGGGQIFDHTIFTSSTVKNSAETATLGLQLTFTSM